MGSREEKTLFSTTLSEGSLLRVSEFPAKRFDLGWLTLTNERHPRGGVFFVGALIGKDEESDGFARGKGRANVTKKHAFND